MNIATCGKPVYLWSFSHGRCSDCTPVDGLGVGGGVLFTDDLDFRHILSSTRQRCDTRQTIDGAIGWRLRSLRILEPVPLHRHAYRTDTSSINLVYVRHLDADLGLAHKSSTPAQLCFLLGLTQNDFS